MEKLLHYVWKHRILPLKTLKTTDGQALEIIDPGLHNNDRGPDFFNAKIRVGNVVWAGNVEIHLRASDWYRHGHQDDAAYNNTILHVVNVADCEVETADGKHPAQFQLDIPAALTLHYKELCETDDYPRCHRMIPSLDSMKAHSWMDALLAERLEERSRRVLDRVKATQGNWEHASFVTLSRSFGFGLNGDAFERWAMSIPLQAVGKHSDNLLQVEAFFLGMAGLIEELQVARGEEEVQRMKREFAFLKHKFQLSEAMQKSDWRYMRTRPRNVPHVRLLQLARLFHEGRTQMNRLLEADDIEALCLQLSVEGLAETSCRLIVINAVVPLLYAYGMSHRETSYQERAISLLEQLPPEDNRIIRQWKSCGLEAAHAADSQALLQLKREYCDRNDCLRCRFGYEYLKSR